MTKLKEVKNSDKDVYTKLENITPEKAREFLSKNINNRNLNGSTVRYYQDMIERNRWQVNGESIKISESGFLLDGQHRLEAICKAGIPVKMFVVYGVDDDSFMTIDAGKPRRYTDYLKVSGKTGDLPAISAASRIAMGFDSSGTYNIIKRVSPDTLLWFIDKHPGLTAAVENIGGRTNNLCSRSIASALKYIFSIVDDVAAECFFDSLISGANLEEGSPILALRNRLTTSRGMYGSSGQKENIHAFVSAFNSYRAGKKIAYLKANSGTGIVLKDFKGQLSDSCFIQ